MGKKSLIFLANGSMRFAKLSEKRWRELTRRAQKVILFGPVDGGEKSIEITPEIFLALWPLAEATELSVTELVRRIYEYALAKGETTPSHTTVCEYLQILVN